MPLNWELFGLEPITTHQVENAVVKVAEVWLPTYVNVVANSMGMTPGSVNYPQSFQRSFDFDNYSEQPLPTFAVTCMGVSSFERGTPDGEVGGWFLFEAGILLQDQLEPGVRQIVSLYATAISMMIEQQGLRGINADDTLTTKLEVLLPVHETRTQAIGRIKAQTFVHGIFQRWLDNPINPQEPHEEPAEPWPEFPVATTVSAEVDLVNKVTPEE